MWETQLYLYLYNILAFGDVEQKNINGDVGNCLWHWVYNIKETTKHAIVVICKSKINQGNPYETPSTDGHGKIMVKLMMKRSETYCLNHGILPFSGWW